MSYPDWKAYESGELDAASQARLQALLVENERARLDFAGYQEYKNVLRQAVLVDQAPQARLEGLLRKSARLRRSATIRTKTFPFRCLTLRDWPSSTLAHRVQ